MTGGLTQIFFLFSPWGPFSFLILLIAALVFFAAESRIGPFRRNSRLGIFIALSFLLSPALHFSAGMLFALVGIHFLIRKLPMRSRANATLVVCAYLLLLIPAGLYVFQVPIPDSWKPILLFFRIQFLFRLYMYIWETRINGAMRDSSLGTFLEYLYCPFFLLVPNLVFLLPPSYVIGRKRPSSASTSLKSIGLFALWGILAIILYQLGEVGFRSRILPHLLQENGAPGMLTFLTSGGIWLGLWYLHHAGGVALQVACARLFGYHIEYDMKWPFLSRSPLEFFQRFHFFVRNFALEFFYRPLLLSLCRGGVAPLWAQIIAATLSYALLSAPVVGWRLGEMERPLAVGIAMGALLPLFILLSWGLNRVSEGKRTPWPEDRGLKESLRAWRLLDWGMVIFTLAVFACSKAVLSWTRFYF